MDDGIDADGERYGEIVAGGPDNWGRWGDDDELGALNHLDDEAVLRGVSAVSSGKTFTLGAPIGNPGGDPMWPTRSDADHHMLRDKGHFESGKVTREPYGGWENSDDLMYLYNHGTTHVDALAHVWYDDELYNGFDAATTKGGIERCGMEHVADEGIVGRGVLLDVARHRDVDHLAAGERITLEELRVCASDQGVRIRPGDVLLIRTGAMELFYRDGADAFYDEFETVHGGEPALDEAGITYSEEIVEWFDELEIPMLGTDTVTAEQTISETTGTRLPLHPILLRDLGVLISEMNCLGELAAECASDDRYEFLYVAAPLHVVGGSGGPVNPVAIK